MATINFIWTLILIPIIQAKEVLVVSITPLSIVLIADRLTIFMLQLSSFIFFILTIYAIQSIKKSTRKNGFFGFSFGILMGVNGVFLAGDLLSLFIWLEVVVFFSIVLLALGGKKGWLKRTRKYLFVNLISIFFIIGGIGLIYAKTDTINIAVLAHKISELRDLTLISTGLISLFIALIIKATLFPFFYWTTKSIKSSLPTVTALLSGLLSNIGIYIILRFYTLVLQHNLLFWNQLLLWAGVIIIVLGVIFSFLQNNFRKVLSYHIISQMGFVLIAIAFNTLAGLTAAIFFIAHNMLAKTNTLLVAGWIQRSRGTLDIKSLSDVARQSRIWGFMFFISAFSLIGLPPLSGFVGKYLVLKAGVDSHHIGVSLVALFAGLITLLAMLKIWLEVFWKSTPTPNLTPISSIKVKDEWMLSASIILAISIVVMGVWAQPLISYCQTTAADLLHPAKYISYVLGI